MRRTQGKDLLLDIDVQGAVQVMKKLPEAVSIFIMPPSPEILEMRLRNRSEAEHVTSETVIQSRLAEARHELKQMQDYKYALVNDVLDQAVTELRAIVLCERGVRDGVQAIASSCRTDAASPRLKAALETFQGIETHLSTANCVGQLAGLSYNFRLRGVSHDE